MSATEAITWFFDVTHDSFQITSLSPHHKYTPLESINQASSLIALMPVADRLLFQQIFNDVPEDVDVQRLRSCDVRIGGEERIKFLGRLLPSPQNDARIYQGIAFSGTEKVNQSATMGNSLVSALSNLFSQSPIPCLITDTHGVVLTVNAAFEQLFQLSARQIKAFLGRYCILRDKYFCSDPERLAAVVEIYQQGEARSLEMHYSLRALSSGRFISDKNLYFRSNFMPVCDGQGEVVQYLIQLQDLSREKDVRNALQESEESYKAFITNSSEAIWCYDIQPAVSITTELERQVKQIATNAHLAEANKVLLNMLGARSLEDVIGLGLTESGSTNYLFDLHHFVKHNYQMIDHDIVRDMGNGKQFFFQISCTGIVENGYLKRVWGTTKDITTRKRFEAKLLHQSLHDSLTGLPNREKLYQDMEVCFESRTAEQISALLLIDLDRFKEINDTLGHNVGDDLLKQIGPRLASEMIEVPGTVARLGGDEFAVFLPRIRSAQQAAVFGHRILDALAQEFDLEGFCTQISASIGISIAPQQADNFHALMRYADIAMYHAKSQMIGLSIYSSDYDPHSPKRLSMIGELGRAIRDDQLCMYYQPKIILDEQRCYGFEALIRWIHPELGFVSPDEFIPIAELTSLIHPLTAWVLEKSIAQCRSWQDKGLALSIAVNLSARNLVDENMPKLVERLLNKYALLPSRLELEITESAIMTDPNRALRVLEALHALGVHLAIDDFGTGYSSLAYLKRLPVHTLKIDNSFVFNMLEDRQDELIVNSTINLAHNLGLTVVAEGVETLEVLNRLQSMGCDEAQGYYIGRPMAALNADEWLASSGWIKPLV